MIAHEDIRVQEHAEAFGQLSEQLQEMLAVTLSSRKMSGCLFPRALR